LQDKNNLYVCSINLLTAVVLGGAYDGGRASLVGIRLAATTAA